LIGQRQEDVTCKELVELITEYLECALREPERRRFERHLKGCPSCVTYLEQMRLAVRALGGLSQDSLSPEARDQLMSAFQDWKR